MGALGANHGQKKARHASQWFTYSLVVALLAIWTVRSFSTPLGHDQISYLVEARRFLDGATIYGPHLAETNPPLIIWFSTLPVILSRHSSESMEFCFRSLILIMLCCSAFWCVRLVQRSGKLRSDLATALFGLAIVAVELLIGYYDFGQREHLLILFLLPYLIGVATGAVAHLSILERCLLGLFAGSALWFKPQDILIVIGLELAFACSARTLRHIHSAEFRAMTITAALLFVLVLVRTPLYTHQVIPLLSDVYWALGTRSFTSLLFGSHAYLLALLFTLLCFAACRKRLNDRLTPIALVVASVGAYVAFAAQHTTWHYHRYPHQAICLLAISYLMLDVFHVGISKIEQTPFLASPPSFAVASGVLVLASLLIIHEEAHRATQPRSTPLGVLLDRIPRGSTVSALSTNVADLALVHNHGLAWGSRFAHLWMLPAIIQNQMGRTSPSSPFKRLSPQTTSRLAAMLQDEVAQDLNYWHPVLVLVPSCTLERPCQGMEGKNLDLVAWFKQSPQFSAAWSRYERQPDVEGFRVYRLVRND